MNSISVKTICRTCLSENVPLNNKIQEATVSVEDSTKSVLEILNIFNSIEVDDKFPDSICIPCLNTITDLYKFILQCENSTFLLKQYIDSKSEDCDVKQLIKFKSVESDSINYCKNTKDLTTRKETFKEKRNSHEDFNQVNSSKFSQHELKNKYILTIRKEHNEEKYVFCAQCERKFKSKRHLSGHIKEVHSAVNNSTSDVDNFCDVITNICNICNKVFKSKYILTRHKKRHIHKGQFLCTICGKGFNSKECLNRHTRVHTGEKKFECGICKKKFPTSNNLLLHSRIHSGIKPYLCTICGKSFAHPTGLTYHVRTHTKEKNYSCEVCGKAFAIQCHLDNHRKIHTDERPFPCDKCEKAFRKKIDLQRHAAIHSGTKPHVCHICERGFLMLRGLNYHMMTHTEERPHECSVCGKGFIRRYYLKYHMIKHHNSENLAAITSENMNTNNV